MPGRFRIAPGRNSALTDDALQVTLTIENRGAEAMPAGLGFHPYFPRTAQCRLSAPVDAMWATDAEVMPTALTAADPRLSDGIGLPIAETVLDNAFTGWRRQATITLAGAPSAGSSLDADPPLGFLVVYSPAGEDYFCAEPVSHCTDAFNLAAQGRDDTGMLTLMPGASLSATVRFRPTLGDGRGFTPGRKTKMKIGIRMGAALAAIAAACALTGAASAQTSPWSSTAR